MASSRCSLFPALRPAQWLTNPRPKLYREQSRSEWTTRLAVGCRQWCRRSRRSQTLLVRVDCVLDLSWLRDEVADCYCFDDGRPGIDPEVAVRLMRAGLLSGMVHDRKLMREAHVNIAMRWFIGYGLHEKLPHHSSLTRIRQRWGSERFRKIFKRTVEACLKATIATGEIVHLTLHSSAPT
jgi:transposase